MLSRKFHCKVIFALVLGTGEWGTNFALSQSYYQKSYALVVGINDYKAPALTDLTYARKDAESMAAYLHGEGFAVTPLFDAQATKAAIIAKMLNFARLANTDDRILVFFSGHGYTERFGRRDYGYIIPYDGYDSATYISMEELRAQSEKMGAAKHQLFIMDCCYGGLLGTKNFGVSPEVPNYLQDITSRVARQILTAGGKQQQVLDAGPDGHSVFTAQLLRALQKGLADLNTDGFITFSELCSFIVPSASNAYQTPATSTLPGHELGEFVFRAPKTATTLPTMTSSSTPTDARRSNANAPTAPNGMVLIPAGAFMMGSEDGDEDEKPVHKVTLEAFFMDKYEVTVADFKRFVNDQNYKTDAEKDGWSYRWDGKAWEKMNGVNWRHNAKGELINAANMNHPVIHVSWNDANAYAQWAGKRLPTEAEWEYAARSGSKQYKYSWGNGNPAGNIADESAKRVFKDWTIWKNYDDGFVYTAPVGSFASNEFGLFDMTGNVWEWCADWYDSGYYKTSVERNPQGPASGTQRVLRGGSWSGDTNMRCANRNRNFPTVRNCGVGFRCVQDVR